jgi:hypothetical protein
LKPIQKKLAALTIFLISASPMAQVNDPIDGPGGGGGLGSGGGNGDSITYACLFGPGLFFTATAPSVAAAEAYCATFPNSRGIVY